MMTFNEFTDYVKENILSYLSNDCTDYIISVQSITKNNGAQKVALDIGKDNNDTDTLVYLEEFYDDYINCRKEVSEIMEDIAVVVLDNITRNRIREIQSEVQSFELVKDRIFYQLVNAAMNKEMLSEHPHRIIADLAVVYRVLVDVDDKCMLSMLISQEILCVWNVDETILYNTANENTPKLLPLQKPFSIFETLFDVPEGMTEEIQAQIEQSAFKQGVLFVLRNKFKQNGASVVLYPGVLEAMEEKFGDFFLLPSSIHEWLLLSSHEQDVKRLIQLVREVNDEQVVPEEILSYNVYKKGKDGMLEVVA